MTDVTLPDSSELTREDFTRSGWTEILDGSPMTHYSAISGDLWKASKEAQESADHKRAKVLLLLAAACSMRLTNKSRSEPFAPEWRLGMSTSTTPDTFDESDINFLAEILDDVNHPMVKGRLADLMWLKKTPNDFRFALEAIDNYFSLDLNQDTWVTSAGDCWERALVLTTMLRTGAGNRIKDMGSALMAKFDMATKADGRYAHWLAETLGEFRLETRTETPYWEEGFGQ